MTDNFTETTPSINLRHLGMMLGASDTNAELYNAIVNLPFDEYPVPTTFMFLGIMVLLLVNPDTGMIDRVALSGTDFAKRTEDVSAKPFHEIKIAADASENIIATAIRTGQPQETSDWKYLFTPALKPDEARLNQANAGIAFSAVYPFSARSGGALIFSYFEYKSHIADNEHFMEAYTKLVNQRLSII